MITSPKPASCTLHRGVEHIRHAVSYHVNIPCRVVPCTYTMLCHTMSAMLLHHGVSSLCVTYLQPKQNLSQRLSALEAGIVMQALLYRSKCLDAEYEQMYTDLARQGAVALIDMVPHHPAALEARVQVLMLQEMDYYGLDPM